MVHLRLITPQLDYSVVSIMTIRKRPMGMRKRIRRISTWFRLSMQQTHGKFPIRGCCRLYTAKEQGKDKFGHGSCDHKAILHAVPAQDVSLVHAQQE